MRMVIHNVKWNEMAARDALATVRKAESEGQTAVSVQDSLSALLQAQGFEAMARDAKTEADPERMSKYARVILKNTTNRNVAIMLKSRFSLLGLV